MWPVRLFLQQQQDAMNGDLTLRRTRAHAIRMTATSPPSVTAKTLHKGMEFRLGVGLIGIARFFFPLHNVLAVFSALR